MIKVKELSKTFDNGYCALDNVSFELPDKGIVCIVGESGSGKTTLLNCLQGAESFDGYIAIDGVPLEKRSAAFLRKECISVIYQDFDLIEDMTIEANLRISAESVGKKLNSDKMRELLESVGLDNDCAKKLCSKLSGGEKQRIAIVRALIQETKIIMADEPTGNLDSANAEIVFDIFKKLSTNMLIVVVTHNEELTKKYADCRIELSDGVVAQNNCLERQSNGDSVVATDKKNYHSATHRTKMSVASHLSLFKWLHSDILMTVLFSIFSIVLFATSFVMYSCTDITYNDLVFKNIKHNSAHIVGIESNGASLDPTLVNDSDVFFGYRLLDAIGLRGTFSVDTPKQSDLARLYNTPTLMNVIESNDITKLGLKMKFGRNTENTDEIVINEYIARCIIRTKTRYDGKMPQNEQDVLGITLKNADGALTIVGIADIDLDNQLKRFSFERYDYSGKEVETFDKQKFVEYKKMEAYIHGHFDNNLVFVSSGYAEKVGIAKSNCNGAYLNSKNENLTNIYNIYEQKKENLIKINSNYTYGVDKVASFFEDKNILFLCVGILMSILSVVFVILASFLLTKNKSNDLLKLRALNMDGAKMFLTVFASQLIMLFLQLATALGLAAILIFALNSNIASTLVFSFKTLFFDWGLSAIFGAVALVGLFAFVLCYIAKLYSKPLNFRKQKTVK
ncbi:MAG: ATP-binding cassette domain-containing protein [Clostridia bacterium]